MTLSVLRADLEADGLDSSRLTNSRLRRSVQSVVQAYLDAAGRSVFCDKSLTNEMHAELLHELFPDAHFICLYRHAFDVIDSMVDASPWGFDAYGVAPFVSRWPASFGAAIGEMWLNTVERIRSFAARYPSCVSEVRYEDLVNDPAGVIRTLLSAVGLDIPAAFAESAPELALPRRAPRGPSDHKIAFTSFVARSSTGRGRRVPMTSMPSHLLEPLSKQLVDLNYDPIDEHWNAVAVDRSDAHPSAAGRDALAIIKRELRRRLRGSTYASVESVGLAIEDLGYTIVCDFEHGTVRSCRPIIDPLYTSSSESLLGLLYGGSNLGSLLRRGEIRLCKPELAQSGQVEAVLDLLTLGQVSESGAPVGVGASA